MMALKARTHTPTLGGSALELALELADYNAESSNSTTGFTIVGPLSISNMFNILNQLESADGSRPTEVGRLFELADSKSAQWVRAISRKISDFHVLMPFWGSNGSQSSLIKQKL